LSVGASRRRCAWAKRRPSQSTVKPKLVNTSYTGVALGLVRLTGQVAASASISPRCFWNAAHATSSTKGVKASSVGQSRTLPP